MNIVDVVIIAALTLFTFSGFGKALFWEIFDLLSFILAFLLSLKFYSLIATWLESLLSLPHSFSNALGFIAVWYLIEMILFILGRLFLRGTGKISFPFEGVFSMVPAFFRGLILIAIILLLLITFPFQPQLKKEIQSSKAAGRILAEVSQFEAPLRNVFGGVVNDTLVFMTIRPSSSESIDLRFKTTGFTFDESLESQMIQLVNKERASLGLSTLTFDLELREVARAHSSDMFKRGYFSHYSPENQNVANRAQQAGVLFSIVGENLAYAPSLELAHNGLMNSPGHRANILSVDYHKIGIGVADGGSFGLMITQVFKD